MKNELLIQYGAMRETTKSNIETIGVLVKQADSLKRIVEKIKDSDIKDSLSSELKEIEETIAILLNKTDGLFDKYDEFVNTVFKDKN